MGDDENNDHDKPEVNWITDNIKFYVLMFRLIQNKKIND